MTISEDRPGEPAADRLATDPLELDPETMRELGYRVVDLLVERTAGLGDARVWRGASRAEMESRLREAPPAGPTGFDEILRRLEADVLPFTGHHDHPRFFGYIPSCPTWPGVLGDFIASGVNIFSGTWLQSAGASTVELVVLDWFRQWVGYPGQASGVLVSGGSQANLTAIACAQETKAGGRSGNAVVYVSTQGHSSLKRALRILGFRSEQVRALPVDEHHRAATRRPRRGDREGRAARAASPSSRSRTRARRTRAPSIRSARSPPSAPRPGSGCTWTRPTAASRS